MQQIFPGVFKYQNLILTKNLVPGKKVYGEKLLSINGIEFRTWTPFRSKICAAIKKGLKNFPIKKSFNILYLGVAEGTTASHLSDIIEEEGLIIGIDISKRTMKKFIQLCEERKNMLPLLADASKPETYFNEIKEIKFDLLYQDISQKNQAQILNSNSIFLKKNSYAMISIKAKSISTSLPAKKVFEEQKNILKEKFNLIECLPLEPFEKEHLFCVLRKK
jgi:fibrillarin-like pre-rRNA processing protein